MPIVPENTSYSVLDFLNWQRDGTLELRPPFQRNAVWRPVLKSSLIDSLLQGYPIPALFIQDRSDTLSFERRLRVVDGQQRLRTVLGFVDLTSLNDALDQDDFTIMRIHDESRAGMRFVNLSEADRQQILNTRLSTYVVDASVTERELLEIFRRMNTYGAKLNAQELRNAEYTGYFKETAYGLAAEFLDSWLNWGVLNRQQVAEMRDAEYMSELLLLALNGIEATTKTRLDRAYEDYDEEFAEAEECQARIRQVMSVLSEVFIEPGEVPRLATRMWIYSLFAVIQDQRFGGPIRGRRRKNSSAPSITRLRRAASAANSAIESGILPEPVSKATRGAANDRRSREARANYLKTLLKNT